MEEDVIESVGTKEKGDQSARDRPSLWMLKLPRTTGVAVEGKAVSQDKC